ncbi:hypothetical protein WL260_12700, partial [Staphylococcus epidermidis]
GLIATLAGVFMTLGPPILGVIDFIGTFIKVFTGAGTVIEALMSVASALAPVFEAIGVAIAAIDAPILLIIAGVAALIAIF